MEHISSSRVQVQDLRDSYSGFALQLVCPNIETRRKCSISIVRNVDGTKNKAVDNILLSYVHLQEAEDGRDAQLRTRLWELGLAPKILLKIKCGETLTNIATEHDRVAEGDLALFASKLDIHSPGCSSWFGHLFDAVTV